MKTFIHKDTETKSFIFIFGYLMISMILMVLFPSKELFIFSILSFWIIFTFYMIFYDEIEQKKYCHNRRVLLNLIKNSPEILTFDHYSYATKMYYFEFEQDSVVYTISYDVTNNDLALRVKGSIGDSLIGFFRSSFTQKKLIKELINNLEKLRGKVYVKPY